MRDSGANLPVACSLSTDAMEERRDAWQALVARYLLERERAEGRLALRFTSSADVEATVRRLAELERECCPFLELSVAVGPEGVRLTVLAPSGVDEVLDAIAGEVTAGPIPPRPVEH